MIWYVYPMWHKVSFTIIAEKHIEYLSKKIKIEKIDELAFPHIYPYCKPLVLLHPVFYCMTRYSGSIAKKIHKYRGIIGFEVADSDRVSNLAVSISHYLTALILPSNFSKKAYVRSGVRVPIHVVPHGLDDYWYTAPKTLKKSFPDLLNLKLKKKLKYLLFFCWHSEYRKGADLVIAFYSKLKKERKDVVLIVKTLTPNGIIQSTVKNLGGIIVSGWLSEEQKMELYDLSDLYLLFSRGGGFELNGLEALARNVPVIAGRGGSWDDYMPDWGLVSSHSCPYVLKDNPIHIGKGVEIDVDKAVDRALEILDNYDEYVEKTKQFKEKFLRKHFTWQNVADKILEIIHKYY